MVREARPSDKEPLMSFIKDIWGGHDYIPQVWDSWIRDESAKMFVVEVEGKQVGMNRVRLLEDGSAWFEGARIHPDYRRMGLASMLGRYSMKQAGRWGAKVFRLTSSAKNRPAQLQVLGIGFKEISRFSVYTPGRRSGFRRQPGVGRVLPEELEATMGSIKRTREYRLSGGMTWESFTALSLTPQVLSNLIGDGLVVRADGAVAMFREVTEGKEKWNQISFVGGPPSQAVKLVMHIFGTRLRRGWKGAFVPKGSPIIGGLRKIGMKRAYAQVVFEREATNG
jgi:GNAT superfamily N-acetyltransferase